MSGAVPSSQNSHSIMTPPFATWAALLDAKTDTSENRKELLSLILKSISEGKDEPLGDRVLPFLARIWDDAQMRGLYLDGLARLMVAKDVREQIDPAVKQFREQRNKLEHSESEKNASDPPANVWAQRETLRQFLENYLEMPEGLARDLVFPSGITSIAAPSGVGKTITIIILAYELARAGVFRHQRLRQARVLFVDTDNPRSLLQHRLKQICADWDITLEVLTREHAPKLQDRRAWEALPASEFDVVVLDSFGGATPGISEKEGKELQRALDVLRHVADRGPAVVVLDNTSKSALTYRGRGEKTERVDAFFEVRDITNWTPQEAGAWWRHLPNADDAEWQERAERRHGQEKIRLAFVCRKFRWGEEPDPFAVEIDFTSTPWSLHDVTEEVKQGGEATVQAEREAQKHHLQAAALALYQRLLEQPETLMGISEAVDFLRQQGLKRDPARALIDAFDADTYPDEGRWTLVPIPGAKGRKKGLLPCKETLAGRRNIPSRKRVEINHLNDRHFSGIYNEQTGEKSPLESAVNQTLTDPSISPDIASRFSGNEPEKPMEGQDLKTLYKDTQLSYSHISPSELDHTLTQNPTMPHMSSVEEEGAPTKQNGRYDYKV